MSTPASRALVLAGLVALALFVGPAASAQEANPIVRPDDVTSGDVQDVSSQIARIELAEPEGGITVPTVPVPASVPEPGLSISLSSEEGGLSQTVVIVLLLTVMAVAPGLLLLTTSFTRFAIVLGLTRNAIGAQNVPPTQVLVGLALFLTLFVMGPVFSEVNEHAIQPLLNGEMD